jgi:hypothetical protein
LTLRGVILPTFTVPIDGTRLEELIAMIIRGLLWHHWKTYITRSHFVFTALLTADGEHLFDATVFRLNPLHKVNVDLGRQTICYEGMQAADPPELSVWRILLYGGVQFSDGAESANTIASLWGAVTGPRSSGLLERLKAICSAPASWRSGSST